MLRKIVKLTLALVALLVLGVAGYSYWTVASFDTENLPENHGKVQAQLFLGDGEQQLLIVGLGGSEGGNAWASDRWKKQRDAFLQQGYAFLAIGYFGSEGTPERLDRISLEGIHASILEAARHPRVNGRCIAVMGVSKGGELALVLASHFNDIKAVVAVVPSSVVFAGDTDAMTTSSFTYLGEPLPFVPVPWSAVPALLGGNLRSAYTSMLADVEAVDAAAIAVERINGPVYLLSAANDEMWPSAEMSVQASQRLQDKHFRFYHRHDVIEGGHAAPLKRFADMSDFLGEHFLAGSASGCPRQ